MRRSSSTWQRVSKRRPCPVCGKPDWCLYTGEPNNPETVICARIESAKRCGEAGWLHILRHDGPTWSPQVRRIELSAARLGDASIDFGKLMADFHAAVRPDALDKLAQSLGVTTESLKRLGVGWAARYRAWAFSMRNDDGAVLGIRLRLPNGKKLSVRGGKEGLFLPTLATNHSPLTTLLVAEGPTDTAALLDLGFFAVGRPSCTGGVKLLVELLRMAKPPGVVIVADGDTPGQRGAETLATVLVAYVRTVRIIAPPAGIKDAREWKQSGAMAADVQRVIDTAFVHKLVVSTRMRRKAAHHGR